MSRTVSARIPKEMHEELRERCNKVGCTMTEWIEHAIEFCMQPEGSTDFDFGGYEDVIVEQVKKDETNSIKSNNNHEGKKPTVHLYWDNGKLVQGETTWK